MKKFYQTAQIQTAPGGFTLWLDQRPLKTPAKHDFFTARENIALACAAEWNEVTDRIDPRAMPITGFVNAAIDRVSQTPEIFREKIIEKLRFDCFLYRADPLTHTELALAQAERMNPAQKALEKKLNLTIHLVTDLAPAPQDESLARQLQNYVENLDPERLTLFSRFTDLTDSVMLTFSRFENLIGAEELYQAANCEQETQFKKWGVPEEARLALENLRTDFANAEKFLQLL